MFFAGKFPAGISQNSVFFRSQKFRIFTLLKYIFLNFVVAFFHLKTFSLYVYVLMIIWPYNNQILTQDNKIGKHHFRVSWVSHEKNRRRKV